MCLVLLVSVALCLERNYSIPSVVGCSYLRDYWFDQKALFTLDFRAAEAISGVWAVMATENELKVYELKNARKVCRQTAVLNRTFRFARRVEGRFDRWSARIGSAGLYTPVIINCRGKEFSVKATFLNVNNCLDKRAQFLPYLYAGAAAVYSTITLIWVVNGLIMHGFHVKCHTMFAIACSARAVELWLLASMWTDMIAVHKGFWYKNVLVLLYSVMARAMLLTVNAAASTGWGVLTENLGDFPVSWVFASGVQLFAAREVAAMFDTWLWLLPAGIAFMFGWQFFNGVASCILGHIPLLDIGLENEVVRHKCLLCIGFNKQLLMWLMFPVVLFPMSFSPETFWESFRRSSEEFLYLLLVLIDLRHYLYRSAYKGQELPPPVESNLVNVGEPDGTYTAVMTADIASDEL